MNGVWPTPQPKPPAPSTAGLPAKLAANVKDADTIVGDGADAFRDGLGELRGQPVVVNQWASWCEGYRFEFPFFRSAAEADACLEAREPVLVVEVGDQARAYPIQILIRQRAATSIARPDRPGTSSAGQ